MPLNAPGLDVLWDAATADAIGADWLHDALAPAGDFGRRARARERPLRRGDETRGRREIERVAALARTVEGDRLRALRAALADAPDPSAAFVRASAGAVLDDADLFEILRFLDALAAIAALASEEAFAAERPAPIDERLRAEFERGRTASRTFYLDDAFTPELATARAERDAAQAAFDAVRSQLAVRVAAYAGLDRVGQGEFVLMRDRIAEPLPPEIRVLREAPTYLLCELAFDDDTVAAETRRDAAAVRVAEAEEAVRAALSTCVGASSAALQSACEALGRLDLLVARVRFTRDYRCVVPQIIEAAEIDFQEARYLPLVLALDERGRAYVPLDFELAGNGVLTGPNMGGKTAALRTVGFLVACVAYGVPVPARAARIPLIDEIAWLGIGTDAPGERRGSAGAAVRDVRSARGGLHAGDGLLSAFAAEIIAARALLQREHVRPLVLVDEFARTTSSREGRALLVALLDAFRARGALALASTHFERVAEAAHAAHYATGMLHAFGPNEGVMSLDRALERIGQAMDYRIRRVAADAPPSTDALALAAALGLDPLVIARAEEVL